MPLFRYLIMSGAGLVFALPTAAITLTLKSNVVATHSNVSLHEVAEISNLPRPSLLPELQRLQVALAPRPGQDIRLTREQIIKALRYESPVLASQMKWEGASAVLVSTSTQSLELTLVRDMAEAALRKALVGKASDIAIQILDPTSLPILPTGLITITAKSVKPETPSQRMSVEMEIAVGEHYRRTFHMWHSVHAKIDVLVAKTDIGSGIPIDSSLVEIQRHDLGSVKSPILANTAQGRLRTRQKIVAGSVLTQVDVEPAPPINRQQEIAVQLFTDGIALKTSGIALSDGEIGKSIRVKNPRSGEVFNALVSAPGVATITVR